MNELADAAIASQPVIAHSRPSRIHSLALPFPFPTRLRFPHACDSIQRREEEEEEDPRGERRRL